MALWILPFLALSCVGYLVIPIGYVFFCVWIAWKEEEIQPPAKPIIYAVISIGLWWLAPAFGTRPFNTGSMFIATFVPDIGVALALLLYHSKSPPGVSSPQGYVSFNFAKPAARGTIVVFHGNAGCAFDRTYYAEAFARRGFRTLLYEYPGYGGRPGSPSAASIVTNAQALIRSLDEAGYGPISVWGESVGSGVADSVCSDSTLPIHGLTLLTPWDSLTHAAAYHYPFVPVSLLLWDKYDSIANLAHFSHPICVICSTKDTILPLPLGLNLFADLPGPKKHILQDGVGHNDWPDSPELPGGMMP